MKKSRFSLRSVPRSAWIMTAAILLLFVALRYAGPKSTDTARADFLALDQLIPPAVPDDQNFAAIPILRGLWDVIAAGEPTDLRAFAKHFTPIPALDLALPGEEHARYAVSVRQDDQDLSGVLQGALQGFRHPAPAPGKSPAQTVLRAFEPLSGILAEISTGLRRPHCRFPIRYERGFDSLRPPFGFFTRLAFIYGLRATALLQVGDARAAADDIVSMLRLGRHWRADPGLLGLTTSGSIQHYTTQFIWLGIRLDLWTLDQLDSFRSELKDVDLFAEFWRSARLELRDFLDAGRSVEEGWTPDPADGGLVRLHKSFCREFAAPLYASWMAALARNLAQLHAKLPQQRPAIFDPATIIQAKADFDASRWSWDGVAIHIFGTEEMPIAYMRRVVAVQSSLEQCLCAIDLEKHRRVHGRYPASLAGLALPADLLTGQPRKYEVRADGSQFRLESTPWVTTRGGELSATYGTQMTQWKSSPTD